MPRRVTLALASTFVVLQATRAAAEEPSPAPPPAAAASDAQPQAEATSDERTKAEATALLEQGKQLFEAGEYQAACAKLEASVEKTAGIGNRFQLATCYEKLDRTASAHALFLEVAEATRALGQPEREQLARERAEALEPRLSRVLFSVSDPPPGLELEIDGRPVPPGDCGRVLPVDPGEHRVRASAPGHVPWTTSIQIAKDPATHRVEVPVLAREEQSARLEAVPPPTASRKAPRSAEPPKPSATRRAAAIALTGVAGVGIVTGAAMTGISIASSSDADRACAGGASCTSGELEQRSELEDGAQRAKTWALVGFGTGAAALAGAAYLYFAAPGRGVEPQPRAVSASPFVGAGPGSVGGGVRGSF